MNLGIYKRIGLAIEPYHERRSDIAVDCEKPAAEVAGAAQQAMKDLANGALASKALDHLQYESAEPAWIHLNENPTSVLSLLAELYCSALIR